MSLNKEAQDKKPSITGGLPVLTQQKAVTPGEAAAPATPTPAAPAAGAATSNPLGGFMPGSTPATSQKSSLEGFMPGAKPTGQVGTGGGTFRNPDVVRMQQAILDLATIASSTDVTSMTGNQEGRMTGNQSRAVPVADNKAILETGAKPDGAMPLEEQQKLYEETKDKKKHLGGSDALGKFIIQNYIPAESYIGKQYLNVDVAGGANRENAAMPPKDLRGIIDTIKRVGSPNAKGEKTVDGVWQNRTNNSLHVIGDLVQAMLKFTEDMKLPVQGYTEKDLQAFKGLVPADWHDVKSQEEFSSKSKELMPHLKSMTDYFRNLNGRVFNNTNLKNYINQKVSFDKVQKAPHLGDKRISGVPGVQFDFIKEPAKNWISLQELSSLDEFKKFVDRVGYSGKDPATVKKILNMVSEKLNSKINLGF